jgi:long-chain acyl-CoA synthetase
MQVEIISHLQELKRKLDIEPEIAQSMLYGDFKNYLVAVIVPDKDFAINWAKENSKDQVLETIVKDEDFYKVMKEVINKVNKNLSVIEQVRKFILIDQEFTIEKQYDDRINESSSFCCKR